jgi:hypothetical protein
MAVGVLDHERGAGRGARPTPLPTRFGFTIHPRSPVIPFFLRRHPRESGDPSSTRPAWGLDSYLRGNDGLIGRPALSLTAGSNPPPRQSRGVWVHSGGEKTLPGPAAIFVRTRCLPSPLPVGRRLRPSSSCQATAPPFARRPRVPPSRHSRESGNPSQRALVADADAQPVRAASSRGTGNPGNGKHRNLAARPSGRTRAARCQDVRVSQRSRHAGLLLSIKATFQARLHFLRRFSRRSACSISSCIS